MLLLTTYKDTEAAHSVTLERKETNHSPGFNL